MASVCDSFHANIWRPSICVNCYKPKSQHHAVRSRAGSTIVRAESNQSVRKNSFQRRRRSRTVSPSPEESKLRQLIANRKMAVVEVGQMPALAGRLPTTLNMPVVGVVKPYAVVDIDAESPVEHGNRTEEKDTNTPRRHSEPNVNAHSTTATHNKKGSSSTAVHKTSAPTLSNDHFDNRQRSSTPEYHLKEVEDRSFSSSCSSGDRNRNIKNQDWKRYMRRGSVEPLEVKSSNSQTVSVTRSHSFRRNRFENSDSGVIIPKRKAPPPPPRLSSISNRTGPRYSVAGISKMPPSSPHPIRRNSAATHQILQYSPISAKQREDIQHIRTQTMMVLARPRAMTVTNYDSDCHCKSVSVVLRKDSGQIREKRSPPEKPPRTLSTFISSEEQNELVLQFSELTAMDDIESIADSQFFKTTLAESHQTQTSIQPGVIRNGGGDESHTCNNRIPKHRTLDFTSLDCISNTISSSHVRGDHASLSSSSLVTVSPIDALHDQTYYMDVQFQMSEVLQDTLLHVYERDMGRLFCCENLWQVDKREIKMVSENTASYREILLSTRVS